MKKNLAVIIVLALVILGLVTAAAIYLWPVRIDRETDGILYRANLPSYSEEMVLRMDGSYFRKPFSDNEFLGIFHIDGIDLPDNLNPEGNVNIHFDKNGQGGLFYMSPETAEWYSIGTVYFDLRSQKITVAIFEDAGTGSGDWSSAGGLIFSAPSQDRGEAVEITNELLDYVLIKPIK
ncbi:MAG TPA: hypothetical protein PLP30_11785 [Clostridia bacterium]|nr:hypothetical protein [Clostridia bacterium]